MLLVGVRCMISFKTTMVFMSRNYSFLFQYVIYFVMMCFVCLSYFSLCAKYIFYDVILI